MTPTAKEFRTYYNHMIEQLGEEAYDGIMIEFAKLHVEAALKEASNTCTFLGNYWITSPKAIQESYPLENIK